MENPQQYQKIAPIVPRIFDTGYGPAKKDYTKGLISETDYRAKTGTMAIASSYDTVLQALIAINLAKITNIFRFTTVSTKQVFSVNTGTIPLGKGFDKEGTCYNYMTRAAIVILPDHSQKGFRVQTSYPTR